MKESFMTLYLSFISVLSYKITDKKQLRVKTSLFQVTIMTMVHRCVEVKSDPSNSQSHDIHSRERCMHTYSYACLVDHAQLGFSTLIQLRCCVQEMMLPMVGCLPTYIKLIKTHRNTYSSHRIHSQLHINCVSVGLSSHVLN